MKKKRWIWGISAVLVVGIVASAFSQTVTDRFRKIANLTVWNLTVPAAGVIDINTTTEITIDGALMDIGSGTYDTADGDNDLGIAGDLEVLGATDLDGAVKIDGGLTDIGSGTYLTANGDNDLGIAGDLEVLGVLERVSQEYSYVDGGKVGATSGWTVGAASNLFSYLLPASQTNSTLIIPIDGLKVGDIITAFKVIAQIESGGLAVTLDADLRSLTTADADLTDASVGAITQISVTADTTVATAKTGLTDTVEADETFYILLTGTTLASTDIDLQGVTVTVTEK